MFGHVINVKARILHIIRRFIRFQYELQSLSYYSIAKTEIIFDKKRMVKYDPVTKVENYSTHNRREGQNIRGRMLFIPGTYIFKLPGACPEHNKPTNNNL